MGRASSDETGCMRWGGSSRPLWRSMAAAAHSLVNYLLPHPHSGPLSDPPPPPPPKKTNSALACCVPQPTCENFPVLLFQPPTFTPALNAPQHLCCVPQPTCACCQYRVSAWSCGPSETPPTRASGCR